MPTPFPWLGEGDINAQKQITDARPLVNHSVEAAEPEHRVRQNPRSIVGFVSVRSRRRRRMEEMKRTGAIMNRANERFHLIGRIIRGERKVIYN